jgi:glycosyltransferase involved in cell wall biosynthesis
MKYVIISSGYNCLPYAKSCYESLCKIQFASKWEAYLISDGSTDGTSEFVESIQHNNIKGIAMDKNRGAAFCRHEVIKSLNLSDEDVILFLGLDDELTPNALTLVHNQYESNKWMTYGNWVDDKGRTLKDQFFNIVYSDEIHKNRDYRKDSYRATALNTFKYFLYKRIPEEDLKLNGEWIVSTTESEVMFSCLEMCGKDKIGVIHDIIYIYNKHKRDNSLNRVGLSNTFNRNAGRKYKQSNYRQIIQRPKRELLEF